MSLTKPHVECHLQERFQSGKAALSDLSKIIRWPQQWPCPLAQISHQAVPRVNLLHNRFTSSLNPQTYLLEINMTQRIPHTPTGNEAILALEQYWKYGAIWTNTGNEAINPSIIRNALTCGRHNNMRPSSNLYVVNPLETPSFGLNLNPKLQTLQTNNVGSWYHRLRQEQINAWQLVSLHSTGTIMMSSEHVTNTIHKTRNSYWKDVGKTTCDFYQLQIQRVASAHQWHQECPCPAITSFIYKCVTRQEFKGTGVLTRDSKRYWAWCWT